MPASTGLAEIPGAALRTALAEEPQMILAFYTFGVTMRRRDRDTGAVTEYAVSPDSLAAALATTITLDTGMLAPSTLRVIARGPMRVVIEYREAQRTALWLEGSDNPVRIPLPGLILIRVTREDDQPQYRIYACPKRPMTDQARLFHAPLPNTSPIGICWGTVERVSAEALVGNSLAEDWAQLLGSRFGSHAASGKSKSFPTDIRQMYLSLEKRKARVYPARDLIPTGHSLSDVLGVQA